MNERIVISLLRKETYVIVDFSMHLVSRASQIKLITDLWIKARVIDNWVPVKRENASQYIIYGNSGKTRFKDISIAGTFTEESKLFNVLASNQITLGIRTFIWYLVSFSRRGWDGCVLPNPILLPGKLRTEAENVQVSSQLLSCG